MKIRIYVEGGGNTKASRASCREGFREFFCKAGLKGRMPQIIASGAREKAFDDFCSALEMEKVNEFIALLVDSEMPIGAEDGAWTHLKSHDKWDKPKAAADNSAHLMVQCMESWFLADKDKLKEFFGKEFKPNALPANSKIENIEKKDVLDGMENSTRDCDKKGKYSKGEHSFDILAKIDPTEVMQASPHARRLIEILIEKAKA